MQNMLNNKWTFQHVTFLANKATSKATCSSLKTEKGYVPCSRVWLCLSIFSVTLQLQ